MHVHDEMRDSLEQIINENCRITLAQINSELRRRLPAKPEIHDRTVSRTLDGMLFRVKLVRPLPADRNRPDVLNKRVDYANWFMCLSTNAATIFGRPEVMAGRGKERGRTAKCAASVYET